ncbi:uncharacterized protein MICPUCDRAFT_54889 [Micromonas pusilla CCMP1545]|uniref:Predicted protein n=1 Tax=Micromonas pusilla (strain CCMP1545) TaxID=564608 RepID=C1NAG2_MICPC|nr:uncharacterized protein MICPUCDRAFT_54889 [Micromonas pusilla CCMP1545]EEH50884.1 predicted protein [Micromonas pusilla CCMP1545]|eukprot:XP_003064904.1 predicted protein [Micromonas pusilla CCMP1545]
MTPLTPPRRARRASADAASLQIAAQSAKQPCPNRARGAATATAARAARRDGGDEVKNTSARALLCFLLRPIARAEIARPRRGLHRRTCPRTPSPLTPHPPRTSRAQNAPPRKRRSPGKPLDRSANFGLFAVARDDVARRESLTAAVIERNWEDVAALAERTNHLADDLGVVATRRIAKTFVTRIESAARAAPATRAKKASSDVKSSVLAQRQQVIRDVTGDDIEGTTPRVCISSRVSSLLRC